METEDNTPSAKKADVASALQDQNLIDMENTVSQCQSEIDTIKLRIYETLIQFSEVKKKIKDEKEK